MSRIDPVVGESTDIDLGYDPFVDDDAELRGGVPVPWINALAHSEAHQLALKPPTGGGGGGHGGSGGGGGSVPPTQATLAVAGPSLNSVGALTGYLMIPPDNASAVSQSTVVLAVNGEVSVYQRSGVSSLGNGLTLSTPVSTSLDGFFKASGTFDPRAIYDPVNHKLIVAAVDQNATGNVSDMWIAVSSTDTSASPSWTIQHFSTSLTIGTAASWADFPQIGVDAGGNIYLTANMFSFSAGSYEGSRLWITNESGAAPLLVDPSAAAGLGLTGPNELFSLAPANMVSPSSTTMGNGEYLVSYNSVRNGANHNALDVLYVTSSGATSHTSVDVGLIDQAGAFAGVDAPQPGVKQTLDADDTRVASVVYANGVLYVAADIVPVSGVDAGHTTAHWWALQTDGAGQVTGLIDQGDISGNTFVSGSNLRSYYPSLAVEANGALAVSFSGSGPTNGTGYTGYASAYEVTIANPLTGGAYQHQGAWQLVEAGVDSYNRTLGGADNRWGDYSSISADPLNPNHVWAFNEYAMTHSVINQGGTGVWGTELGYF
jgi:hypothetical protein